MAKWFGKVGYCTTMEIEPGIWSPDDIVEREYSGEIVRNLSRKYQQASDQVNDNLTISNSISILADPFAVDHFCDMRYAEIMGVKWKIDNVEVQYPRLILSLGGVYNG